MTYFNSRLKEFMMILLTLLGLVVTVSCTVKEDRFDCPCRLSIILDDWTKTNTSSSRTLSVRTRNNENQHTFHSMGEVEIKEEIVPRGFTSISVISGNENGVLGLESLTYGKNSECDKLYAYSSLVDCRDEVASDTVRLHKSYAAISLEIIGSSTIDDWSVRLEGSYNGIDLFSLTPIQGPYICHARRSAQGYYEIIVPRQGKGPLFLTIYDSEEKMALSSIDLEELLYSTHFDWAKPDIDDIKLTLDIESSNLTINIEKWRSGDAIDEVI